jgi:putative endonuclease
MTKQPCVYILASGVNGTLYIGVTGDLLDRVSIHKQDLVDGFKKRHDVHRLVYYEVHETFEVAFRRETQMKKWRRLWKIRLIEQMNPQWNDLFDDFWGCSITVPEHRRRMTAKGRFVDACLGGRLRGRDDRRWDHLFGLYSEHLVSILLPTASRPIICHGNRCRGSHF